MRGFVVLLFFVLPASTEELLEWVEREVRTFATTTGGLLAYIGMARFPRCDAHRNGSDIGLTAG